MDIKKNVEYNRIGHKMTIEVQLKYEDLKTFTLPECCVKCPVGFMQYAGCGRNVPFADEDYKTRPNTCKLKKIEISDLLNQ